MHLYKASLHDGGLAAAETYRVTGELRMLELLLDPAHPAVALALGVRVPTDPVRPYESYTPTTHDKGDEDDAW